MTLQPAGLVNPAQPKTLDLALIGEAWVLFAHPTIQTQ
jgi:hypothetical protein